MYIVTLIGGIASGKSAASRFFSQNGAGVVDCDEISRNLTAAGGDAVPIIAKHFGSRFIGEDGSMDRPSMRHLIFSDDSARMLLESLIHPMVRDRVQDRLGLLANVPYALVEVPVLRSASFWLTSVQRVLLVRCDKSLQRERLITGRGFLPDEADAVLGVQERENFYEDYDDVIDNNYSLKLLESNVRNYHETYCRYAKED
ncbi:MULTISPECIES: dephospho-CoA kinase [Candidatus Ichthyocystis]|uniref:dephospho-CoA kinase n=1 Tax=Candidatus Ichthyocystis TaxID=2929841 RepID=UPI000B877B20|nr:MULTISPECIES: dephospho-CoA kinase [Ichthyocystis]